jgi:hypothetical protein
VAARQGFEPAGGMVAYGVSEAALAAPVSGAIPPAHGA